MKKNLVPKLIYWLTYFIQVALIVTVFIIQYLSDKKAGVMRHLYTKKMQFENTIFSLDNLDTQRMIVIVIGVLLLVLALYVIKNKKDTFLKTQSILGVVISLVLYLVMSSSYFINMLAYHYFIITIVIVLTIQIVIIIATLLKNNKLKN